MSEEIFYPEQKLGESKYLDWFGPGAAQEAPKDEDMMPTTSEMIIWEKRCEEEGITDYALRYIKAEKRLEASGIYKGKEFRVEINADWTMDEEIKYIKDICSIKWDTEPVTLPADGSCVKHTYTQFVGTLVSTPPDNQPTLPPPSSTVHLPSEEEKTM